jgi:DNA end-binding protein Ku
MLVSPLVRMRAVFHPLADAGEPASRQAASTLSELRDDLADERHEQHGDAEQRRQQDQHAPDRRLVHDRHYVYNNTPTVSNEAAPGHHAVEVAGIVIACWYGMPRSIWKGAITFGLVTIPVGLFSATERRAEISFRLLHEKDSSPIDYRRYCAEENVEVQWSEIVKGYEYEKGRYVVLADEDFAKARVPGTQSFDVRAFVPAKDIDPMYFEQPYYLSPSGKTGVKAYALLRDALAKTERVGVGTIVLRQRERLAALKPMAEALVLTTMRFAHEIRSPDTLGVPGDGAYGQREMDLGVKLVESLASEWKPDEFRDTYHEVLLQIIEQKVEGKAISVPSPPKPPKVTSLVRALEQSLESTRESRRPPARAAGRPRRPRRARHAA